MSNGAEAGNGRASFRHRVALSIGRFLCRIWFILFYRFQADGLEHIPLEGPVVLVANHQSFLDPIAMGLLIRKRTFRSIARMGLFTFRPFAFLIESLGAIPIDQEGSSTAAIKLSIQQIADGHALVIFPEGGRSRNGVTQPFKGGVLLILKRTKAPVVPVAIEGAYDAWPAGEKRPRLHGRVVARALPAIPYDELMAEGADAALSRLRRVIETERLRLREEMTNATRGRYPIRPEGAQPYWTLPHDGLDEPPVERVEAERA